MQIGDWVYIDYSHASVNIVKVLDIFTDATTLEETIIIKVDKNYPILYLKKKHILGHALMIIWEKI